MDAELFRVVARCPLFSEYKGWATKRCDAGARCSAWASPWASRLPAAWVLVGSWPLRAPHPPKDPRPRRPLADRPPRFSGTGWGLAQATRGTWLLAASPRLEGVTSVTLRKGFGQAVMEGRGHGPSCGVGPLFSASRTGAALAGHVLLTTCVGAASVSCLRLWGAQATV